jgi:hypothetical protein
MPATLATVGAILKEIYEPKIRDQLENSLKALRRIEKTNDGVESTVGGKYVTFPIHTRRNAGIGARTEQELLPTPGQQGFSGARVPLKYLYGGVRLTGQTFELAEKNYQAFSSALDAEVNGLRQDVQKDQNRQVYGNSSGAIATVTADGSNTVTVANPQYLQLGMQIDIIDGTTFGLATPTAKVSNRQITSITGSVVTYSGTDGTLVAGDVITRYMNANREWSGLASMVANTGVYQNLDPAVEPLWKSVIDSNAGTNRPLSEGLMILMADTIQLQGGNTTVILCGRGVRRAYYNLLVQQRQFTNTREFAGGFTGLAFATDEGDIPVVVDNDAPDNRMYFLNEKEITLYREADWSWMNRDGSQWARVTGFDQYEAMLYQYSEIGCHRRNSQGAISDITHG